MTRSRKQNKKKRKKDSAEKEGLQAATYKILGEKIGMALKVKTGVSFPPQRGSALKKGDSRKEKTAQGDWKKRRQKWKIEGRERKKNGRLVTLAED